MNYKESSPELFDDIATHLMKKERVLAHPEFKVDVSLGMIASFAFNVTERVRIANEEVESSGSLAYLEQEIIDPEGRMMKLHDKIIAIEDDMNPSTHRSGKCSFTQIEVETLSNAMSIVSGWERDNPYSRSSNEDLLNDKRYLAEFIESFNQAGGGFQEGEELIIRAMKGQYPIDEEKYYSGE